MAFWDSFTGLLGPMPPMTLEGITGHAPGAFKGMTMKDFFDKDKWKREQRIGTSGIDKGKPLVNERTGEPITSNWYTGNQPAPEAFQAGIRESRPPGKEAYPQGGGDLLPSGGRDRPFPMKKPTTPPSGKVTLPDSRHAESARTSPYNWWDPKAQKVIPYARPGLLNIPMDMRKDQMGSQWRARDYLDRSILGKMDMPELLGGSLDKRQALEDTWEDFLKSLKRGSGWFDNQGNFQKPW